MTLTVHNAEIHTATVEVKTLTISGKQVTLAVFRQLPKLQIRPGGVPWGRVNYHPDKCEPGSYHRLLSRQWPAHVHVVWQLDADLFRATYEKPRRGIASPAYGESQDEFDECHDRAVALWDSLWALPQLFIAV